MAVHAICVRTTMLSLCNLKISHVFKYKISITFLLFSYVLERVPQSDYKDRGFCDNPLSSNAFICF